MITIMVILLKQQKILIKPGWLLLVCVIVIIGVTGCMFDSTEPIEGNCASPTFSLSGGTYYEPQIVGILCSTSGADIRFTVDGTLPDRASQQYTHPLHISNNLTLRARAFMHNYRSSDVSTVYYNLIENMVTPVYSDPPGGTYQFPQSVSLGCSTEGATIYYSINNEDIEIDGHIYTEPLEINVSSIINTVAKKEGMVDSFYEHIAFNINNPRVSTPLISHESGAYTGPIYASLYCSDFGATMRYTTDGSEPTAASALYTNPVEIDESLTFKAKAYKQYYSESQTAFATYIINPVANQMIYIQGGTFNMGGTINPDEQPIHPVTLSPYYINKFEITQGGWSNTMGRVLSKGAKTQNQPITGINFYDILVYCNKRSIAEDFTPVYTINNQTNPDMWGEIPGQDNSTWNTVSCDWSANGYRLPTEAEWEYAARGATTTTNYTYAGSMDLFAAGWWYYNSDNAIHYVGLKLSNGININDMSGNVWEWVWDWYSNSYYGISPADNPIGPAGGTLRAIRGGCYSSMAVYCRVAGRMSKSPGPGSADLGFRLVRTAP
jgi:sulfatase modifying factor 1